MKTKRGTWQDLLADPLLVRSFSLDLHILYLKSSPYALNDTEKKNWTFEVHVLSIVNLMCHAVCPLYNLWVYY